MTDPASTSQSSVFALSSVRRVLFTSGALLLVFAYATQARADDATPVTPPAATVPASTPQDVFVNGDRAEALKRSSGSGTTISHHQIENAQPESNAELLRRVPGLQIRTEDPMGLRLNLGVRGLSPVRSRLILMEEDGIPVVVSPYGEPELYYTPIVERVQRIDVIKGSDVLRHGPQTVGAVIELHTYEPTERPSFFASYQVGSRAHGEAIGRFSNTTGNVGYVAQIVRKRGDGYRNMGYEATDAFGKAELLGPSVGELTLKLGFHDDLARTTYTGLTDALYRADPARDTIAPHDYFSIRRYEIGLGHLKQLGERTELHSALFFYQMELGQRTQDLDRNFAYGADYTSIPDPQALFFRDTTSLRNRTYDVAGLSTELSHRFRTGPLSHHFTLGVRGMGDVARRQLSSGATPTSDGGPVVTDDTTHILGLAAWAEDQIAPAPGVLITPAFRYEHSTSVKTLHVIDDPEKGVLRVENSGRSDAGGAMPGLGVIVGSPRFSVFSSAYLGYSAPRASQAITPSGQDANLHAERSKNLELGARGRVGNWLRAEADGFVILFDNQLVSNNPLFGGTSEFVDGGATRHIGAEGTATVRIGRALALPFVLDLAGQYTFVQARFASGTFAGKSVPYSPEHSMNLTLDAALPMGLSAEGSLSHIGRQYTDENNEVQTDPTGLSGVIDGYTTLDVGARYRYRPSGVSVGLSVKGLLNQVHVSDRLPDGIFTAGFRQIFLTFAWSTDG